MQYTLMHKTKPVLHMEIDESTGIISAVEAVLAPEHLPVGISCVGDAVDRHALNNWWVGRSIPASRDGLRNVLEALNIPSPQILLTKCYGLSLSDQYWVRPENSNLHWEDINFFDNPFSDDVGNILFGHEANEGNISFMSPDNTSDGWLRKKWMADGNKRYLVKGGSGATRQEPYNEVLASAIMKRLGVSHAPYTLTMLDEYPYSVCEGFITAQTELVSAWHILQTQKPGNHVSMFQHYLNCCDALGIPDVRNSLAQMLTVDFIIANEDRHFSNFGAVRNAETLKWHGAAPIFDCGTSLWHDQPVKMIRPLAKLPSKPFRSEHAEQIKLVASLEWLDLSALRGIDEELREILRGSAFIEPARCDALCYGLRKRVEVLGDVVREKSQRQQTRER